MDHSSIYLILACIFGFFIAWGTGANDVANAVGTSVGSKALTIKKAIIISAIFETAGALLAGSQVTYTVRSRIIDLHLFTQTPTLLIYGMLAVLLASGLWLTIASYFKWPISTTHSIVGAIAGFAIIQYGFNSVHWEEISNIAASWILTPVISGIIAHLLYRSIQGIILHTKTPLLNAKRYTPIYIFFVALIISLITLTRGLQYSKITLTHPEIIFTALGLSFFLMFLGMFLLKRIDYNPDAEAGIYYESVQRIFATLMIFTACAVAFAHGSNDVANAVGPVAAVVSIIKNHGSIITENIIPYWILALGAVGIVTGLAMYGHRVISTIGNRITHLTPCRGFAAEFATAMTVMVATGIGLPVSTTQTLVGALIGVGFAKGVHAVNFRAIRDILISWIVTIPTGALLSAGFYLLFRKFLG